MNLDLLMQEIDRNNAREEPDDMQLYQDQCICNGFDCACGMPVDVIARDTNVAIRI